MAKQRRLEKEKVAGDLPGSADECSAIDFVEGKATAAATTTAAKRRAKKQVGTPAHLLTCSPDLSPSLSP